MSADYHQTIVSLEGRGVSREYILGWAGGYLGTPKREEQRCGDAYEAGYADGVGRGTERAGEWIVAAAAE